MESLGECLQVLRAFIIALQRDLLHPQFLSKFPEGSLRDFGGTGKKTEKGLFPHAYVQSIKERGQQYDSE